MATWLSFPITNGAQPRDVPSASPTPLCPKRKDYTQVPPFGPAAASGSGLGLRL